MNAQNSNSFSLFTACAFPIHFWAILWILNDVSWVASDTSVSGAIGVAAYGLVFAFIESLFVFLFALFLTILLPKKWSKPIKISLSSMAIWGILIWGVLGQLFFILGSPNLNLLVQILGTYDHPLRFLYVIIMFLVTASLGIPLLIFYKSKKFQYFLLDLIEKLKVLVMIYFSLDFIGLIIIIFRNV